MTLPYIDPKSEIVKVVLAKKATQLATAGLEQLLEEAEAQGISRDEALEICDRTIEELRERDEENRVFERLWEAFEAETRRRGNL